MKGSKYLSELITEPIMLRKRYINLIDANTSAGKTYFALTALPKWAGSPEKVLYLIDTSNGEYRLLENTLTISRADFELANYNNKAWGEFANLAKGKMPVMTYAGFGSVVGEFERRKAPAFWKRFEYIVCDEIHNLLNYQRFGNRGNENLARAEKALLDIVNSGKATVIGLSSTSSNVRKRFGKLCRDVPYNRSELRTYETTKIVSYTGIETILAQIPPHSTGIAYTSQIAQIQKTIEIAKNYGIRACGFWSINASKPMDDSALALREYVLKEETIPEDVDLIVINRSTETSVKIQSVKRSVDYMIIHDSNPEIQAQVRGRYCGDLGTLYLHTQDMKDNRKIIVPPPAQYLYVWLDKAQKDKLCEILNLRNERGQLYKWTTVYQSLREAGYDIEQKRTGNKRYHRITLPKGKT